MSVATGGLSFPFHFLTSRLGYEGGMVLMGLCSRRQGREKLMERNVRDLSISTIR